MATTGVGHEGRAAEGLTFAFLPTSPRADFRPALKTRAEVKVTLAGKRSGTTKDLLGLEGLPVRPAAVKGRRAITASTGPEKVEGRTAPPEACTGLVAVAGPGPSVGRGEGPRPHKRDTCRRRSAT